MKSSQEKIIKQFSAMPWQSWLHRRFDLLVTYLIMVGGTKEVFKTQGIDGEFPISLYDTDDWYSTPEMFALAAKEAERFLQQKNIITLTHQCDDLLATSRKAIEKLLENAGDAKKDYEQVIKIITPLNIYVWIAHSSEAYYHDVISKAASAFVAKDKLETFIGDISFPIRKNSLALMEDDIRAGESATVLHKKYAWIKARGGFRAGYTLKEIKDIQKEILSKPKEKRHEVDVPPALQEVVREVQELVYLRTLRTDALWELYYLAQPIFDRGAKAFGVSSVKDYIPEELLKGKLNPRPNSYAVLKNHDIIIVTDPIIKLKNSEVANSVRGVVAYRGVARGPVKIVFTPQEISKVQVGDILVTNMTIPSYVSAMHKAAAFVTNEGGITCHAAILARELKKPCITGTKIATQIFKDGEMVEVDANQGIIKKLN
ncbi:MAG: hypothetical protein HY979_02470 [Candidatus Magasanikbacteria bacterium]|nr:hypothetical protein [Candidatus Magasanikbacteria bacterium]